MLEDQLLVLEPVSEVWNQQAEDHKKILQTMEKDQTIIICTLLQNLKLKDQLAELQDGIIRLTNDNVKLTSTLQLEQILLGSYIYIYI
jgi:DNA polymerase I-like protein with 3'-5' exonuclease and polymerase domains